MKIKIHPLFFAMGLLSALFGGFPVFTICVLTALLHECGHIFCAERLGYECTKISLMPYGAATVCEIEGISAADEIRLALAGPAVNFFLCIAVAGLWWFLPVTYAYTDILFYSNAAMLLINLLPAYPLDGGRVVKCALIKFLKPKIANIALRALNLCAVAALITVYFTLLKNLSLIAVAVLLLCSAFQKAPPVRKINFSLRKRKKGREVKYVILDEEATYKDALKYIDDSRYLVLQFYGDKYVDEITEDELFEKLQVNSLYDKILPL